MPRPSRLARSVVTRVRLAPPDKAQRRRRENSKVLRERAAASRRIEPAPVVQAAPSRRVWHSRDLPRPQSGWAGVPLSEGVSSVLVGAIAYVPIALVSGYAAWNYVVALVLVVGLSYALISRKVVVGTDFVAIRSKPGPKDHWDHCEGPPTVVISQNDGRHRGYPTHGSFTESVTAAPSTVGPLTIK